MIPVEYVSSNGIKLRTIFLDNGNWLKLFLKHRDLIRLSIIVNVLKLLVCRTSFLGYHQFVCPTCSKSMKVPHSCKSRFCPSCGKKATDTWIKNSFNTLPKTIWQHITFTMPSELWVFFWLNRYLMNRIPLIAATIVKDLALEKGFLPGIFLAIHTFGRDLKRNIHIHLSTTAGGLSLFNETWIGKAYFYHQSLKNTWKYHIISLLREEFKKGLLLLPPHLKHITSYTAFNSWTAQFYNTDWVVHLKKQSNNMKANVDYLGKYLKRPLSVKPVSNSTMAKPSPMSTSTIIPALLKLCRCLSWTLSPDSSAISPIKTSETFATTGSYPIDSAVNSYP